MKRDKAARKLLDEIVRLYEIKKGRTSSEVNNWNFHPFRPELVQFAENLDVEGLGDEVDEALTQLLNDLVHEQFIRGVTGQQFRLTALGYEEGKRTLLERVTAWCEQHSPLVSWIALGVSLVALARNCVGP